MILGIDHIALSTLNMEETTKTLEAEGYTCTFNAPDVSNCEVKKNLLSHYQTMHDLAFFRSPRNHISIEVTNHGNLTKNISPYQYFADHLALYTPKLKEEKHFWKTVFRFKEESNDLLTFSSPVHCWSCKIKMIEKPDCPPSLLDDQGYSCLAFLTTNLQDDAELAKKSGATDIIEPFQIRVANRNINVIMFRTPGGAICELIKILK